MSYLYPNTDSDDHTYMLITASGWALLPTKVDGMIKRGWTPLGAPFRESSAHNHGGEYVQVMYKPTPVLNSPEAIEMMVQGYHSMAEQIEQLKAQIEELSNVS